MGQIINTKTIEFGGQTLLLRLNAKTMVNVERKLGRSLIGLFMNGEQMRMPLVGELLLVLHEANSSANISQEKMLDLYDNYLRSGKSYMDLMDMVMELLSEAGYLPKKEVEAIVEDTSLEIKEEITEVITENNSLV